MAEGHKRIVTPLLAVSYALFALGALLRGAYGRSRAGMIYATFVSFCIGGWHILLTVTPSLVARRPELVAGYYALAALPALLGLAMLYLPPRIVQRRIFGRHAPG